MTAREMLERMAIAIFARIHEEDDEEFWAIQVEDVKNSYMGDVQAAVRELMEAHGYDQQAIDLEAFFRDVLEIMELEL